jgi:hypothetical protein
MSRLLKDPSQEAFKENVKRMQEDGFPADQAEAAARREQTKALQSRFNPTRYKAQSLKRKYGGTMEAVLAFGEKAAAQLAALKPAPAGASVSPWYLRFAVQDAPGVLASIASNLSEAGVSIESMIQCGRAPAGAAIVMITHEAPQSAVERALKAIAASDKVRARPCMIPMEAV